MGSNSQLGLNDERKSPEISHRYNSMEDPVSTTMHTPTNRKSYRQKWNHPDLRVRSQRLLEPLKFTPLWELRRLLNDLNKEIVI